MQGVGHSLLSPLPRVHLVAQPEGSRPSVDDRLHLPRLLHALRLLLCRGPSDLPLARQLQSGGLLGGGEGEQLPPGGRAAAFASSLGFSVWEPLRSAQRSTAVTVLRCHFMPWLPLPFVRHEKGSPESGM